MLFELKKEEALSLICIPHWTYCCLTSRQSSYFIQLFDVPLEGVARFTFLCKFDCLRGFNISSRYRTVDRYGAPTRVSHLPPSLHCGAVLWGTVTGRKVSAHIRHRKGLPKLSCHFDHESAVDHWTRSTGYGSPCPYTETTDRTYRCPLRRRRAASRREWACS